ARSQGRRSVARTKTWGPSAVLTAILKEAAPMKNSVVSAVLTVALKALARDRAGVARTLAESVALELARTVVATGLKLLGRAATTLMSERATLTLECRGCLFHVRLPANLRLS